MEEIATVAALTFWMAPEFTVVAVTEAPDNRFWVPPDSKLAALTMAPPLTI